MPWPMKIHLAQQWFESHGLYILGMRYDVFKVANIQEIYQISQLANNVLKFWWLLLQIFLDKKFDLTVVQF